MIEVTHPFGILRRKKSLASTFVYPSPQATQDWVMQEPMFIVIVGIANSGYNRATGKKFLITPNVAAPQPTSVIGPRNNPNIASTNGPDNNKNTQNSLGPGNTSPVDSTKARPGN